MPLKHETKSVKHGFTEIERGELNIQFRHAVKLVNVIQDELDQIKATYKAKVTEQEACISRLDSLLDAGFEMRNEKCVVVYRVKEQEKDYYLETCVGEDGKTLDKDAAPILTEKMTEHDLQLELVEAESRFELRDEIILFPPTEKDMGLLIVGRLNNKWYGAIRAVIGGRKLEERLDGEQPCTKKRFDCVSRSVNRFASWVEDALGKDTADGFKAELDNVIGRAQGT